MKKYILAPILILTTYVGFAQPYFPVERGVTTYYMSFGGGYNSQIIDSNMNTYFFNPQFLQTTFDSINYCEATLLYSFWGKKMTLQGDTLVHFFNQYDEAIELRLNTNLKDKWLAYSSRWVDIYFEHSSNDSLKYFPNEIIMVKVLTPSVVMKDSSYIQYQDVAELPILKLNEKHGLVVSANFFNFPYLSPFSIFYNLSDIYPSGLINSKVYSANYSLYNIDMHNITWDSIFRFEVGDEFHTQTVSPNTREIIEQRVNKIIDANYSQDSFTYKIARVNYLIHSTEPEQNQSFYDTINTTYKHNPILDLEPYSSTNLYKTDIDYNTIVKSSYPVQFYSLNNDTCIQSSDSPNPTMKYVNGAGGPYYGNFPLQETYHHLLYYKNQNGTWGTSISKTVGINEVNQPNQLFVYPNPAQNEVYINLKQQNGYFTLYNMVGVICFEQEIFGQTKVNLSNLKSGLYYYTIKENSKVFNGKLIKE